MGAFTAGTNDSPITKYSLKLLANEPEEIENKLVNKASIGRNTIEYKYKDETKNYYELTNNSLTEIMYAGDESGMGTWLTRWYGKNDVLLDIDTRDTTLSGTEADYSATIMWTLTQQP